MLKCISSDSNSSMEIVILGKDERNVANHEIPRVVDDNCSERVLSDAGKKQEDHKSKADRNDVDVKRSDLNDLRKEIMNIRHEERESKAYKKVIVGTTSLVSFVLFQKSMCRRTIALLIALFVAYAQLSLVAVVAEKLIINNGSHQDNYSYTDANSSLFMTSWSPCRSAQLHRPRIVLSALSIFVLVNVCLSTYRRYHLVYGVKPLTARVDGYYLLVVVLDIALDVSFDAMLVLTNLSFLSHIDSIVDAIINVFAIQYIGTLDNNLIENMPGFLNFTKNIPGKRKTRRWKNSCMGMIVSVITRLLEWYAIVVCILTILVIVAYGTGSAVCR